MLRNGGNHIQWNYDFTKIVRNMQSVSVNTDSLQSIPLPHNDDEASKENEQLE